MGDGIKQRLLAIGVKRLGEEGLAKKLKVGHPVIMSWVSGKADVPDVKVLALIDALDQLGALGDDAS